MAQSPSHAVKFSAPDLATIMNSAQEALKNIIATKPDSERLLADMVRLCGQALQAGAAGTWVTQTPDTPTLVLEHNLGPIGLFVNNTPLAGLNVAVRRAAREAKPVIVPPFFVETDASGGPSSAEIPSNPSPFELLFIPMKMHGKVAMVLMMAVPPGNDAGMHRTQINFLQKMVGAVEQTLTERHISLMERDHGATSTILKFAEQVHKHLFVSQVAVDIANLTRDAAGADRATVELYPKVRKKVVAVSNVDEANKRSAVFQAQRLILDYVRDRHISVVLDRTSAKQLVSDPSLQDAATAYFTATTFDGFVAAPIKQDDKVLGVVITEFADGKKAQTHGGLVNDLCRVAASSVTNAIEYENIPFRKTLHTIGTFVKAPISTKRAIVFTIIGLIIAAMVLLCTVPANFDVPTDCNLRPVAHTTVNAHRDGKIIEVKVRTGEHVYPNPNPKNLPLDQLDAATRAKVESVKPLFILDTVELEDKRADQVNAIAELKTQLNNILPNDPAGIGKRDELQKRMDTIRKSIEETDRKIAESRIYSPIEGIILTPDIESSKWKAIRYGEPLAAIASFKDWVLIVDIPESEVATVRGALAKATRKGINDGLKEDPGIEIRYALYPWPEQKYVVHARGVEGIIPSSVQSNSKNVYQLEVPVSQSGLPPSMLSGVTGRAKIHIGKKPLASQWLRGPARLWKMTFGF